MAAPQPSKHAKLSPSSAYKWMTCPGSVALETAGDFKDSAGHAARVGTFQHHVGAMCLEQWKDAKDFLGYEENVEGEDFTFDEGMAELVQTYIDTVRSYVGKEGELFVENELDISWLTGEPDAVGTADAIVVCNGELIVIDLKTGHNNVDAKHNEQLLMYAMAALPMYKDGRLGGKVTLPVEDDGMDLV